MAGIKPAHIWEFYRKLKARGMTLTKLAALPELQTTHAHLSQVINGTRGERSRRHIAKYLTREETDLLGWTGDEQGSFVPEGTLLHVEQRGGASTQFEEKENTTNPSGEMPDTTPKENHE